MSVATVPQAPADAPRLLEALAPLLADEGPRHARLALGALELSVARLDERRLVVSGTRPAPELAPLTGRAADGTPLVAWHLGLARYYDVTAWSLQPDAFIAGVLTDFAPEAFARASVHHTASRP